MDDKTIVAIEKICKDQIKESCDGYGPLGSQLQILRTQLRCLSRGTHKMVYDGLLNDARYISRHFKFRCLACDFTYHVGEADLSAEESAPLVALGLQEQEKQK